MANKLIDTTQLKNFYAKLKNVFASKNHSHDLSNMINDLSVGEDTPTDNDYMITQYIGGGETHKTYHRRNFSTVWKYFKAKSDSLYASKSHTHTKSDIGLGNVDNTADKNKSVASATKATQDSQGQQINTTYIKGLSVSGRTLTVTKGDGTNSTLTTQDTMYGVATTSANGLMSASDKTKLNGIANNANNYTHPSTHGASMITQDSSHRFVTDSEKSTWNSKASTAVATQSSNGLLSATDKRRLDGLSSKNMNMNLTSLYSTQLKGGTCQVTLSQNISNFMGLIFETVDNSAKRRLMLWRIPNGNGNTTTYPFEYPLAYNCGVYHDANTMINNAIWSVSIGNYSTSSNVITFTSNLLSGTTVSPKPITAIYGFNFI